MAEVVINNVRAMAILIVMICRQAVEPPAVPRSSRIAAATTTTTTSTAPTSRARSRS